MENKFSKFINLQGKYLTSLLILLALSIGQMWGEDATFTMSNIFTGSNQSATVTSPANASVSTTSNAGNAAQGKLSNDGNYFQVVLTDNTFTAASINGYINSNSTDKNWAFQFSTDGGTNWASEVTQANDGTKSAHDVAVGVTIPSGANGIRVVRRAGTSTFVYSITLTLAASCTKPGTPTALAAGSVTHNSASLSWTAGANSDGHKIYIEKKSDKTKVLDWTDATSPYAATGLDPETTYTFKVKAKGATGYCDLGDEASADFATEVDPSATTYKVTLVPAGGTIVDATGWTLNAGNYEKEVSDGAELALPTFTKTNRTFKTWRKSGPVDVTSPITVTADVTLTAIWNVTLENVIYSWEGAEGGATEVGGTAAGSADGLINQAQAGYYCLKINGKNDWSTDHVDITLSGEEKVKTGDKITYWGFYSKDKSASARPKMRDGNSPNAAIFDDTENLPNLYSGGDPAERTFTVPADINTNKVQITRSQTGSNTWISKIQITREVQVEEGDLLSVTFDSNGGSAVATALVASGSPVAKPADPTWAHHRFNGWKLSSSAYDFSTPVTSSITLVADWIQLYTITYANGGGSGDAPTQEDKAQGETFTVAANTFVAPGEPLEPGDPFKKEFDKWNDGTNDYAPDATYTVGTANVTLTAVWKAYIAKFTVHYMDEDGTTSLGDELVNVGSHPTASEIDTDKDFYTFAGWTQSGSAVDLDDISAAKDEEVTLIASYTPKYASSVNIEQWILDNKRDNTAFRALLDARNYKYANLNDLDSLNAEKNDGDRNEPYLGQKIKTSGGYISFLLKAGSELHVKFGNIPAAVNLIVDGESPIEKTASFDYTAGATDEVIKLATTSGGTVVFKQIMIDEAIAAVKLHALVTYDANGGTFVDDGKTVKYTGTPLVIADATPADPTADDFDGWHIGTVDGAKIDGSAYEPTKDVTLVAKYLPKPSPFSLTSLTYQVGSEAAVAIYEEGTYEYTVTLPYAHSYDAIVVAATIKEATSDFKAAISQPSGVPGDATFTVVDGNTSNEQAYVVHFVKGPKDGASIIKVATTGNTDKTVTGLYAGDGDVNLNGLKMDKQKYIGFTLAGTTLQAGDRINVHTKTAANTEGSHIIFYDNMTDKNELYETGEIGVEGDNIFTINAAMENRATAYVYRSNADAAHKWNGYVDFIEVLRPIDPVMTAITINGRVGVVDPLNNKHFNVTIPYEADLANLTIVETIYWNAAHATTPKTVTSNGGDWVEYVDGVSDGNNTYRIMDKDGDYTDYTITLTRDVQKFVVTYFDGSTSLGTEEVAINDHPTATGIVAPKKQGYNFLGWNRSSSATAAEDLNDIAITATESLYAIYEERDCSAIGEIFSLTPKANELTEDYAPKGDEERDFSEYATLVGGEVYINNGAATDTRITISKSTSYINLVNGEDGYIHVLLDCPLKENDTIKVVNTHGWKVSVDKSSGYVNIDKAVNYYVVPAAWNTKYDFYIRRVGSNLTISSIKVIRPIAYTISFDLMGHGSAAITPGEVVKGGKITAPTAPTDDDYAFSGWYKENTLENEWDFANDVVTANTTLYAKWVDLSDATLKSLKYGDTEITLEDGVYEYNVNLSSLATSVPALTAVTSNPGASADVTNGTFDTYGKATSTVEVTPEKAGAAHQTYTVNFTKLDLYAALVDVTGYTEWNWSGVATDEVKINDVSVRGLILANYIDAPNFEKLEGQENARAYRSNGYPAYQGKYLRFHTTVPGRLTIRARNSSGNPKLSVNGKELAALNGTVTPYTTIVPAGDVVITSEENEMRIYSMTFDPNADYTRNEMLGAGVYGTICLPNNVPAGGLFGATVYALVGKVEATGKIAFDEIVSGELEAGVPYVFQAHGDEIKVFYGTTHVDDPVDNGNGMYGTFEQLVLTGTQLDGVYYFAQRALWSCAGAESLTIPANRAYVKLSELPTASESPAPGRRRVLFGVNGEQTATDIDNLNASEKPVKLLIDGQLFIIRGEKMFDATGRLVK